jgi:hypothetical protein
MWACVQDRADAAMAELEASKLLLAQTVSTQSQSDPGAAPAEPTTSTPASVAEMACMVAPLPEVAIDTLGACTDHASRVSPCGLEAIHQQKAADVFGAVGSSVMQQRVSGGVGCVTTEEQHIVAVPSAAAMQDCILPVEPSVARMLQHASGATGVVSDTAMQQHQVIADSGAGNAANLLRDTRCSELRDGVGASGTHQRVDGLKWDMSLKAFAGPALGATAGEWPSLPAMAPAVALCHETPAAAVDSVCMQSKRDLNAHTSANSSRQGQKESAFLTGQPLAESTIDRLRGKQNDASHVLGNTNPSTGLLSIHAIKPQQLGLLQKPLLESHGRAAALSVQPKPLIAAKVHRNGIADRGASATSACVVARSTAYGCGTAIHDLNPQVTSKSGLHAVQSVRCLEKAATPQVTNMSAGGSGQSLQQVVSDARQAAMPREYLQQVWAVKPGNAVTPQCSTNPVTGMRVPQRVPEVGQPASCRIIEDPRSHNQAEAAKNGCKRDERIKRRAESSPNDHVQLCMHKNFPQRRRAESAPWGVPGKQVAVAVDAPHISPFVNKIPAPTARMQDTRTLTVESSFGNVPANAPTPRATAGSSMSSKASLPVVASEPASAPSPSPKRADQERIGISVRLADAVEHSVPCVPDQSSHVQLVLHHQALVSGGGPNEKYGAPTAQSAALASTATRTAMRTVLSPCDKAQSMPAYGPTAARPQGRQGSHGFESVELADASNGKALSAAGPLPNVSDVASCKAFFEALPEGMHILPTVEAVACCCTAAAAVPAVAVVLHKPTAPVLPSSIPHDLQMPPPRCSKEFQAFVRSASGKGSNSTTTPTQHEEPYTQVAGIVLAWTCRHAFYVPMQVPMVRETPTECPDVLRCWPLLAKVLTSSAAKITFSCKAIINTLRLLDVAPAQRQKLAQWLPAQPLFRLAGPHVDLRVMAYLLHPGHKVTADSREHQPGGTQHGPVESLFLGVAALSGWSSAGLPQLQPPPSVALRLAPGHCSRISTGRVADKLAVARDALFAVALHEQLMPAIDANGLTKVHNLIEQPMVRVLADMENRGMPLDAEALTLQLRVLLDVQSELLTAWEMAARLAGIQSPMPPTGANQQVPTLLWSKLSLRAPPNAKVLRSGDASTSSDVLTDLLEQPGCPAVVRHIVDYRSNERYIDFLQDLQARAPRARHFSVQHPGRSGAALLRMSARIEQTVVDTGRLAMDEPNLQVCVEYTCVVHTL